MRWLLLLDEQMSRGLFALKVSSLSRSLLSFLMALLSLFPEFHTTPLFIYSYCGGLKRLLIFALLMPSLCQWMMLRSSRVSSLSSQLVVPVTALMSPWWTLTAFSLSHRQRGRWLRAVHRLPPTWKHGQAPGADKVHQKRAAGALQGLQKCRSGCSVSRYDSISAQVPVDQDWACEAVFWLELIFLKFLCQFQECPSGVVNEENFKTIYSQFFPQGGKFHS